MRKLLLAYLKFWLKSKNHHGVQSPFVYNFVTKCLYNKSNYNDYDRLKSYRKNLYRNNSTDNSTNTHVMRKNMGL